MGKVRHGFTLIEAMIVVVVVGVLAMLAIAAYRHWVHTAYLAEAQDMVKAIRAGQEAFRAENGGYLNVSQGLGVGNDYPAARPGNFKTAWGGPCTQCNNQTSGFGAINVSSAGPLTFGYSTIADNTAAPPGANLVLNGSPMDLSSVTAPWYIVEGDGDTDGDGVFCNVYGFSSSNQVYVNNDGE
jgi:prepilin-type N-terminal cleavage/methylation domain-containing protein